MPGGRVEVRRRRWYSIGAATGTGDGEAPPSIITTGVRSEWVLLTLWGRCAVRGRDAM
ncbi:hypothetical protein [Rhodococcus qingshengii]|uniref:hypothetical protein n=1 Tax=Rhodococcus qingshengii TaxID=334542 RepID=UPI00355BA54A